MMAKEWSKLHPVPLHNVKIDRSLCKVRKEEILFSNVEIIKSFVVSIIRRFVMHCCMEWELILCPKS